MQTIRMGLHIRDFACLGRAVKAEIASSGAIANIVYVMTSPAYCNDRRTSAWVKSRHFAPHAHAFTPESGNHTVTNGISAKDQ